MSKDKMIEIIRKEYAEVVQALKEAENAYNTDKRSVKSVKHFILWQHRKWNYLTCVDGLELNYGMMIWN